MLFRVPTNETELIATCEFWKNLALQAGAEPKTAYAIATALAEDLAKRMELKTEDWEL